MGKSAEYRKKLKEANPDKYKEYLEKQKLRAKQAREKLKESVEKNVSGAKEKRDKIREQTRIRSANLRARRSNKKSTQSSQGKLKVKIGVPKAVVGTRFAISERRSRWRDYKRSYRSQMSAQKKRRIKEKDRKRKQEKRRETQGRKLILDGPYTTKKSVRNATSKAKVSLPKSGEKFAFVIDRLIERASPQKRKALDMRDLRPAKKRCIVSSRLKEKVKEMPTTATKAAIKVIAKYASQRKIAKELGVNRKIIGRVVKQGVYRKARKFTVTKCRVYSFYKREDISRQLPGKRYARKEGPGFVMQMSLKAAYGIFRKEHQNMKIGFTRFTQLRPKNVHLISMSHRDFCLCVYCLNIKYKLLALNRQLSNEKKILDENHLLNVLLCNKTDGARFHAPQCVEGTCEKCKNLAQSIRNYCCDLDSDEVVTWSHWERRETAYGKKKRVLATKREPIRVLLDEFITDVCCPTQGTTFIQHIFVAHWQFVQYRKVKDDLPDGWILMVIDFAKNRNVFYQDEIKEAFFGQEQITIHPIVMFYRNDKHQIVRDVLICISEDRDHDVHAVKHFLDLADKYLKKQNVQITRKVIFSDGCTAQYKCSKAFADLSLSKIPTNRNFFGSEHGKGESDGETGILNRMIDRAIVGRKVVIQSAEQMYKWCVENVAQDEDLSKRNFVYISNEEINRSRPYVEVSTVNGCRKLHQLCSSPNKPYILEARSLSCFCKQCSTGKHAGNSGCVNRAYVQSFVTQKLKLKPSKVSVEAVEEEQDLDISDLFSVVGEDIVTDMDALFGDDLGGVVAMDLDDRNASATSNNDAWPAQMEDLNNTSTRVAAVFRDGGAIEINTGDVSATPARVASEFLGDGAVEIDPADVSATPARINTSVGSHLGVQHGSDIYPAVVIDTPEDFQTPPPLAFYGLYYQPAGEGWRLNDTPYLILSSDVVKPLDPPDISMTGARMTYSFKF